MVWVVEVKPVKVHMNGFSTYNLKHGLYRKEGDELYAHYLMLEGPRMDAGLMGQNAK